VKRAIPASARARALLGDAPPGGWKTSAEVSIMKAFHESTVRLREDGPVGFPSHH
jgi:hypothetical protein